MQVLITTESTREARALISNAGGQIIERPGLRPGDVLANLTAAQRGEVARFARVTDAPAVIVEPGPIAYCGSPDGPPSKIVGEGWDGPGLGGATLTYTFGDMSAGLGEAANKAAALQAMAIWSAVAKVDFVPGTNPNAPRNCHILFGDDDHIGCGWPFNGALAHASYPPSMPPGEPQSGDVHINRAFDWSGTPGSIPPQYIVMSMLIHELGHSLGLAHDGDGVMQPYYTGFVALKPFDVWEILRLYAPRTGGTVSTDSGRRGGTVDEPPAPPPPPPPAGREGR